MSKITKEELQERINNVKSLIEITETYMGQTDRVKENLENYNSALEIYELALTQLEEQDRCCGNCQNWGEGKRSYRPCDTERGYLITKSGFYCAGWRGRIEK